MSASDGGFYQLYQVSLSGVGTVTFTGTTADGVLVSQTINVSTSTSASGPRGFASFAFPASFTALEKVTFTLGSVLMTNLVATETFPITAAASPTINAISGTMPGSPETIIVDSDTGVITINGVNSNGIFNGTPFSSILIQNGTVREFVFQGDLDIPASSKVTGTGSLGISLYATNDVNVQSGVQFLANGSLGSAGPGGGTGVAAAGGGAAPVRVPPRRLRRCGRGRGRHGGIWRSRRHRVNWN